MPLFQKNPFTVRGHLARCWLFTYRTPPAAAQALLPTQLEAVTHGGYAFWNIVVCTIHHIRPAALPAQLGLCYHHVAYRLHARTRSGTEGLYFLRSDCDSALVSLSGNLLTDFNFHTTPIAITQENSSRTSVTVSSPTAAAEVIIDRSKRPELSWNSPFTSVSDASSFLKYKPFGLSPAGHTSTNIVAISRDESSWKSTPVAVPFASWKFLEPHDTEPELAFDVAPIDYVWNRATIEP